MHSEMATAACSAILTESRKYTFPTASQKWLQPVQHLQAPLMRPYRCHLEINKLCIAFHKYNCLFLLLLRYICGYYRQCIDVEMVDNRHRIVSFSFLCGHVFRARNSPIPSTQKQRRRCRSCVKVSARELCECMVFRVFPRTKGVRNGGLTPLSLIYYKNFITCAKKINCFRILFAC